ncbi:Uncharacterised protein [Mycobacteroides abscessus subsp. abscessus]|nr:Uncharacterised protein [Mycobacteroides abscessus subsp. abscessus]
MRVSEAIAALQRLQQEHGDVEVSTGGPEGDDVSDIWFDADCGIAYVG